MSVADERASRIGRNEAVFRVANERLESLHETFGSAGGRMELVCECGDARCAEMIALNQPEYEAVRAEPELFIVATGHASDDVERVVRSRDGYDVVRKHSGEPSRIAYAADPRRGGS